MIRLEVFFYNHFDTFRISDDKLDVFTQDHIQRLKSNNADNAYDAIITATEKAYGDFYSSKTTESYQLAQREATTIDVEKYAKEFQKLVRYLISVLSMELSKKVDPGLVMVIPN